MSTITRALVSLDEDLGATRNEVLQSLAERFSREGRVTDAFALFDAARRREDVDPTGLPGGIALPQVTSSAVVQSSLAFARLNPGIDFGAGPSDIVFMTVTPAAGSGEHPSVLSRLARQLMDDDFLDALREARSREEALAVVRFAIGERMDADDRVRPAVATVLPEPEPVRVADPALPESAPELVADQGEVPRAPEPVVAGGAEPVVQAEPEPAPRVEAEPVWQATPQGALPEPAPAPTSEAQAAPMANIAVPATPVLQAEPAALPEPGPEPERVSEAVARRTAVPRRGSTTIRGVLLTSASAAIAFVAIAGLLIAAGFALGGPGMPGGAEDTVLAHTLWNLPAGGLGEYLGAVAYTVGTVAMTLVVPVLAGAAAFAIAGRSAIAPGVVAGAAAVFVSAGFLGGMLAGVGAGIAARWLSSIDPPPWLRAVMPSVIIPVLAATASGVVLVLALSGPIAALSRQMGTALNNLAASGTGIVTLGLLLGLMVCFDLGGPVSKVALTFAVGSLATASEVNAAPYAVMGAVMAAGMVPALAMALASTVLARGRFTDVERDGGRAAWVLGACSIPEGAIPFAVADPIRVIPASMLGGAVAGAVSTLLMAGSHAPHGGLFALFELHPAWAFLVAVGAGTLVAATAVVVLRTLIPATDPVPGPVLGPGAVPGLSSAEDVPRSVASGA